MDGVALLSVLGPLSVSVALVVLAQLSRRLGRVTQAAPYFIGFYVAAFFVLVAVAARLMSLLRGTGAASQETPELLLYTGSLALGVTLGVAVAWRYWSWLLAERD